MHTILFVCTGNTCRSPMAEAIAQHRLDEGLLDKGERYLAASAGVGAAAGVPPSPEAVRALDEIGIACDGRSKPLTAEMIHHATIVFAMTDAHVKAARALVAASPADAAKIRRLDPEGEVEDPVGMGQEVYRRLARRFMELVPRRLQELL